MLYTHNHNYINNNSTYTCTNAGGLKYKGDSNTQADPVVQVRTHLLTSNFGSSTRGERQCLQVFRNHTMLTTPQNSVHLVVQSQFLNTMVGTQLLNIRVGIQLQLSAMEADNPTVCLHGPKSTPNSLFQNLQILRTITSGHDVIHTPAPFTIWGLLWQFWLSYPLHASVKLFPMSVHLN